MVSSGAFGHLLVVEVTGSAAGAYCGKLFGDYGAEVVVVGEELAGAGAPFYSRSKHRVGPDNQGTLVAEADVVIQSSGCDPIAEPIEPHNAAQVVVRISPFADTGPYRNWRSTDLVDAAVAGHLRLSGDPDREPLQGVPDLVHHAAGVAGFVAATAALIARARTGQGQLVETSHQEVLAALHQFTLCRYTHNGAILNRLGNRYAGPGEAIGAFECADGWVGLALAQDDQVERMLEVTGLVTMLERPDVGSVWDLMTTPGLLDSELIPYLKTQRRDEVVELFQALRLPCAPIAEIDDVLSDPHLADREFWSHDADDPLGHPGPPFRMSNHPWRPGPKRRPADSSSEAPMNRHGSETVSDLADGPLSGFRVIDMTRVWAGPLAAKLLADLGAEVVMTEVPWTRTARQVPDTYVQASHFFPDDEAGDRPWNRSAFFNKYAVNKLSTVVELDKEAGRQFLADLLPTADVLIENYSPRVMPGFGFDSDALHAINPDLIYVTMPGYGRSGPHTDWVAYGPTIDGHVGHTALTGYRGEGPWKCGIAWPDPIGGLHGAAAALVALLDRLAAPDQGGQTAEVAQIESAINMIGQHLIAGQQIAGRDDGGQQGVRLGNRRRGRAPQGVYRCRGEDRWVAISVVDDRAWIGLCQVLEIDHLSSLGFDERWARHDELDELLANRIADRLDGELMRLLQSAGVPAGAVADAADVMADPQLNELGFFVELAHDDAGTHRWPRFPARLSATPATMRRPAPLMGAHNHYAACDLAGYDNSRYEALIDSGVLRTEPPH